MSSSANLCLALALDFLAVAVLVSILAGWFGRQALSRQIDLLRLEMKQEFKIALKFTSGPA